MKNFLKKARKGFSLVELLIAVVVLGILGAMLIAAGTAAQNKARVSVASNDIDSVRNAVYTAFMMKPQVMQFTDGTANWAETIVGNINEELDENWQWKVIPGAGTKSGPVAQTITMRDPWNNPYTMYIYTDTFTTLYSDESGTELKDQDSVVYVVIASAGPNGTGAGMGETGTIGLSAINAGDATTGAAAIGNMVNNTDGIDDLGVVIRIRNGSTTMATFGWGAAALGDLNGKQWVFCGAVTDKVPAGVWTGEAAGKHTKGSSLDQYPNLEKLSACTNKVIGNP